MGNHSKNPETVVPPILLLIAVANQENIVPFVLSFVQVNLGSVVIELGTCEAEYISSKFDRA